MKLAIMQPYFFPYLGYWQLKNAVNEFGSNRDEVYQQLKKNNVHVHRYLYPLISHFPIYKGLESANPSNLPVAEDVAKKVLCLPLYYELSYKGIDKVISIIKDFIFRGNLS